MQDGCQREFGHSLSAKLLRPPTHGYEQVEGESAGRAEQF